MWLQHCNRAIRSGSSAVFLEPINLRHHAITLQPPTEAVDSTTLASYLKPRMRAPAPVWGQIQHNPKGALNYTLNDFRAVPHQSVPSVLFIAYSDLFLSIDTMAALAAVPNESLLTPEYIAFSNAPVLLTQFGSLFAVTSVVVVLRCYVRAFMIKSFGKDDWLMMLAYAFAAATFGVYVEQTKVGMGKHLAVVTMDTQKYEQFLKLRQVASILAAFGVALVKISIAYFLLRLVVHRGYIWFLHGLNIFMALYTLACVGTLVSVRLILSFRTLRKLNRWLDLFADHVHHVHIWQCIPVEATWNLKLRPPPLGNGTAKCFSPETFAGIGLTNTIITIITDFMVALLPVPLIWQLQLNWRAKLSLIFVLTLGIVAAIAAIVKSEIQKTIFQDPDPYVYDRFTLWRFIEFDVGIIAASLPALKPMLNRCLGAARTWTSRAQQGTSTPNSLGYRKQSERSDKAIALNAFKPKANTVSISTGPSNGAIWKMGSGKESDESILPLHNVEQEPSGIVVTRDVHVG
ncbi:hypothetical protein OPT61_g815 [Boeremia exigua]|uniref:Uncharacterized protein n=1 Tax=Boeremia exigua TaxID=749465 RepID=A0ACC2ISI1_9PLEO|nr:hypothetical protein OPT61_g815 [Boeremia exigua]